MNIMQKFEFTALTKIGKQAVCGSYLHDVIIDRHYIFHPEQVAEDGLLRIWLQFSKKVVRGELISNAEQNP